MRPTTSFVAIVLAVVAAWMSPTPAQAADQIDVLATVDAVFPGPGGDPVAQLEWGVRNLTTDSTLSVILNAYIVYSNGVRQQVFPPQAVTLGPGEGVVNLGFVIVPDQAGPGTATFYATGRVQRSDGSSGSLVADSDTFVVP